MDTRVVVAAALLSLPISVARAEGPAPAQARPPPLAVIEPPLPPRPGILDAKRAERLLQKGDAKAALPLYRKAWDAGLREAEPLYNAGCAAARTGDKAEALTWLQRSIDNGLPQPADLLQDDDLVTLRGDAAFQSLAKRPPRPADPARVMSTEVRRLVDADQAMRRHPPTDQAGFRAAMEADAARLAEVKKMVAAGALTSGLDYRAAALIAQHGTTLDDFALARHLAVEAVKHGERDAIDLATMAWDRWLMNAGYPQRFGTQYKLEGGPRGKSTLYPVDPAVTDAERAKWEALPLAEIPTSQHFGR